MRAKYDTIILVPRIQTKIKEGRDDSLGDSETKLTPEEQTAIREFFMSKGLPLDHAVTFGDVTLPEHYSDIRSRSEIFDFSTSLVPSLPLAIPIVSANMESVTGLDLAVAIEREGGLAFPPQTLPIDERIYLIRRLSRSDSALIDEPLTCG